MNTPRLLLLSLTVIFISVHSYAASEPIQLTLKAFDLTGNQTFGVYSLFSKSGKFVGCSLFRKAMSDKSTPWVVAESFKSHGWDLQLATTGKDTPLQTVGLYLGGKQIARPARISDHLQAVYFDQGDSTAISQGQVLSADPEGQHVLITGDELRQVAAASGPCYSGR